MYAQLSNGVNNIYCPETNRSSPGHVAQSVMCLTADPGLLVQLRRLSMKSADFRRVIVSY